MEHHEWFPIWTPLLSFSPWRASRGRNVAEGVLTCFIHERATRYGFEVFQQDWAEVQRDYHSLGTASCPVVRTRIRIASISKTPPARCAWAPQRTRRFREDSTG